MISPGQVQEGVKEIPRITGESAQTNARIPEQIVHCFPGLRDCKNCPLRSTCIGKSDFKTITHSIDKPLYDAMHKKMQSSYAKRVMKRRSSTAEQVLGTLINFLGMKRVFARGIAQANKHVIMNAIAYNLKKLLSWKVKIRNSSVHSLFRAEFDSLFNPTTSILTHIY